MRWVTGLFAALLFISTPLEARGEVAVRLGKVQGPSWSRVRAAVQVVMTTKGVRVVRSGEQGRMTGQVRTVGGELVANLSLLDTQGRVLGRAQFRGEDGRTLAADVKARLWAELGPSIRGLGSGAGPVERVQAPVSPRASEPSPSRARESKTSRPRSSDPRTSRSGASSSRAKSSSAREKRRSRRNSKASSKATALVGESRTTPGTDAVLSLPEEGLRFSLGVGIFARELSWVDDIFQSLSGYQLGAAPALRVDATWFPAARFEKGAWSWLGVDVEAELPFAVSSSRDGVSFPTAASAWRLGILGRIPTEIFEGQVGFGFAERRFHVELSDEGFALPDLPEVRYQTLQARAAALFRLADRLDVNIHGGWGFMLDAGSVGRGTWFPRSQSHTARAGAAVALHITKGLSGFGRFDWEGAFFDLLPEPGDARVAGGMLDNYFLASVGVAFSAR